MVKLVYFSDARQALNRELMFHPECAEKLAHIAAENFELRLSEIASWFGIILDGDYYPQDLDGLCEILTKKLYESRSGIILN